MHILYYINNILPGWQFVHGLQLPPQSTSSSLPSLIPFRQGSIKLVGKYHCNMNHTKKINQQSTLNVLLSTYRDIHDDCNLPA